MAKKYKIIIIVVAALLVLGIGGYVGYTYFADGENKVIRVAKEKVEDVSPKDESITFIGNSKVEYNKKDDYYVVSGFMEVNDEYNAKRRSMYIVLVEENMGEYRAGDVKRTDDDMTYDFVDYFSNYDEDEEY